MGGTPSVILDTSVKYNHFAIQFGHSDKFRLILASDEIVNLSKSILSTYFIIQELNDKSAGFIEFKLKGNPWTPSSSEDVRVKYFLCSLLKEYYAIGWHIKVSTDLKYYGSDASVLIFERAAPVSTQVICINLYESDKIRVLAPDNVIRIVKEAILAFWPKEIQKEKQVENSWEFKLKGNPWSGWSSDNDESYYSAALVNGILEYLYRVGWVFTAAIDSGRSQTSINALYFKYNPEETQKDENRDCNFLALSLNKTDRIRLINALPDLIEAFQLAMPQIWPKGIQKEFNVNKAYEFKLKGNPWWSDKGEAIESRRLVGDLLSFLSSNNWFLYAVCDISRSLDSKSTFFFRQPIARIEKPFHSFCISLNESDKIRVIGRNPNMVNVVRSCIMKAWPRGIQDQCDYYGSFQFKLKGNPFTSNGEESIYACVLMMHILDAIQAQGLTFVVSADVSGKYITEQHRDGNGNVTHTTSYSIDLDSWFFADIF